MKHGVYDARYMAS